MEAYEALNLLLTSHPRKRARSDGKTYRQRLDQSTKRTSNSKTANVCCPELIPDALTSVGQKALQTDDGLKPSIGELVGMTSFDQHMSYVDTRAQNRGLSLGLGKQFEANQVHIPKLGDFRSKEWELSERDLGNLSNVVRRPKINRGIDSVYTRASLQSKPFLDLFMTYRDVHYITVDVAQRRHIMWAYAFHALNHILM